MQAQTLFNAANVAERRYPLANGTLKSTSLLTNSTTSPRKRLKSWKEKIQTTEIHKFGGNWIEEKLKRVEKYLKVCATIMNNQNLRSAYIIAFLKR